ncbi:Bug family tripartite tricarboxylate transporter substrate binding protein [Shinella sp.]|uniref:Bug family tripartite tricarboxylate transporter substrate binding protein n=1 Tax=Shinella sp. TaxID=1870904 RepID=UPI003F708441
MVSLQSMGLSPAEGTYRRRNVLIAGLVLGLGLAAGPVPALAQEYPDRVIQVIVPFPPGGGTDTVSRAVSDLMGRDLGQPLIVENRGGANGAIGTQMAAAAEPDGYTLYIGNLGTMAITPNLDPNVHYDPLKNFVAITQINASSTVLVVNPKLGIKTFEEFVVYAKANPGKLNYASSSPATILPMEMLKQMAGLDLVHIPYKGSGPAMTDILAGHVDVMFGGALATVPHVKSGALIGLAVAGSTRTKVLPDLPTVAESGYPDFAADSWNGIFAPAGTSPEIIAKLNKAAVVALKDPDVAARMENEGAVVIANSAEDFAAYVAAEHAKWKTVIAALPGDIKLD